MEYRIEKMDAFRIVGVVVHTTVENGDGMQAIPALWDDIFKKSKNLEIADLMDQRPHGLLGVSVYNTDLQDARKFDYYIASASGKPIPAGMHEYIVPAATWAAFPCKLEDIHQVEVDIVKKWGSSFGYKVLNTGYENGNINSKAPDLEVYLEDGTVEVWVAVEKI